MDERKDKEYYNIRGIWKMTGKRRSLTIREENNNKIQNVRSQFLFSNIEIDYTTMVNIFIELGDLTFNLGPINNTDITNVFATATK